jgi:glucose/arabinose dehydrogenase/mono/diheme cytochrome c family protein
MTTVARLLSILLLSGAVVRAALPTPDPDDGGITLPPGFRALVVADNVTGGRKIGKNGDALRFITVAPNGDLYAKTLWGGIFAMRDTDGDGRFDKTQEFGSGGGTGIMLRDGWLYHSSNSAVYRYKYTPGQLVPSGEPETIVSGLPDVRNTHNAKTFAFDGQGRLLVEVGSPYNVYSDGDRALGAKGKDPTEFQKNHGGFWRFDADKPNQTQADGQRFSTGHRHSIALAWNPTSRAFFMAQMGRDQLNAVDPVHYTAKDNAEGVSEEFHVLREGANLGWPFTHYDPIRKARMLAPEFGGDNEKKAEPGKYPDPLVAFPAHWAPLQMTLYTGTQFPAKYRGGMFITFHGSWNRAPQPQEGYNVCFIPFDSKGMPTGSYEVFASGFPGKDVFTAVRDARYRPGGVAVGPDGSLYISETNKGRIWRIIYTGEPSTPAAAPTVKATAPVPAVKPPVAIVVNQRGKELYNQMCATCHMADGSGAGNLQPALLDSAVVKGDPAQLIRVILKGPAAVLPADRPKYSNVMAAFGFLRDRQIADVATYLRQAFGEGATAIEPADVIAIRKAQP